MDKKQLIILFDGSCMLCNNFVQFVLKHDNQRFIFVSSSSLKGMEICKIHKLSLFSQIDTIYLIQNGKISSKSTAILSILYHCGLHFQLLSLLLRLIPTFIRDYFYDIVSKNRHKIIKSSCALVDSKNRERIVLK